MSNMARLCLVIWCTNLLLLPALILTWPAESPDGPPCTNCAGSLEEMEIQFCYTREWGVLWFCPECRGAWLEDGTQVEEGQWWLERKWNRLISFLS